MAAPSVRARRERHSGRPLIIAGSLGGLFAGNLLRQVGWDVSIFERSARDLDSRGGGIVLQPEVVEVFRRASVDIQTINLGVRSQLRPISRMGCAKQATFWSVSVWRPELSSSKNAGEASDPERAMMPRIAVVAA